MDLSVLPKMRSSFNLPMINGKPVIYFAGNSLGLQPKAATNEVLEFLNDWATLGVEGHFDPKSNWYEYHKKCLPGLAHLTGALESELACMNALTVNLHLLLTSFYRPIGKRNKILVDYPLFPSDKFALESVIRLHGLDPKTCLYYCKPDKKGYISKHEVLQQIDLLGDQLSLLFFSGVQFYSGQFFDISFLVEQAHKVGAMAGFDLAHAIGNVPLQLHNWNVDFAVWCSYKYLNSGPGGVSGIFIHEQIALQDNLRRHEGWWGHKSESRFEIDIPFDPDLGTSAWQLSNAPIVQMAIHKVALDLFLKANIMQLRKLSMHLTAHLYDGLKMLSKNKKNVHFRIITPENEAERGCQISIYLESQGAELVDYLRAKAIIVDYRKPGVVRLAPTPMYNTFDEVTMVLKQIENFFCEK